MTDWTVYQKCPVCGALLGAPCTELSGFVVVDDVAVGLEGAVVESEVVATHSTRKLRAEAVRTGGQR